MSSLIVKNDLTTTDLREFPEIMTILMRFDALQVH